MITALLPPSRAAPARHGEARSPNYPGPSRAAFCNSTPLPRNLCPRTLLARVTPQPVATGARPWAVLCAYSPRAGATVPGPGQSRRPWASGPAAAVLAPACRARQYPAHAGAVPTEPPSLARKRVQTELPSGLAASSADSSRHRHPETPCRLLANPRQVIGLPGASAPAAHPPYECRLPAGLTECDGIGIGDSGRAPGARAKGLDHWSSELGRRRPYETARLGGACPRTRRGTGQI